jgi:hypothetical protein
MKIRISLILLSLTFALAGNEALAQRIYNPTYISEETQAHEYFIYKDAPAHSLLSPDTSLTIQLVLPQIKHYPGRETDFYRDAPAEPYAPFPTIIIPFAPIREAEADVPGPQDQ